MAPFKKNDQIRLIDESLHQWIEDPAFAPFNSDFETATRIEASRELQRLQQAEQSLFSRATLRTVDVAFGAIDSLLTKVIDRQDRKSGELPHYR